MLALFLTFATGLPSPAFCLRPTGLEESDLVKAAVTEALTKGPRSTAGLKDVRTYKPPAIPVTVPGLRKAGFVNPEAEAIFLKSQLNRLDPNGKKLSVRLGGVTFFRARHGNQPVWAFYRTDKARVREINPRRRFIGSRYVKVSNAGLRKAGFVNVAVTSKYLNARLNRISRRATELEAKLGGVPFHKFVRPAGPLWTFERTQTKKVKTFTKNHPFLKRGEIRVRGEGLEKEGFTTPHRVAKELIERLDALDPKGERPEVELEGVKFFRRYSVRRPCWAFKRKDLEKVRRLARNPVRFDPKFHVAVSMNGLELAGFTRCQAAAQELTDSLTKLDPEGKELETRIGGVRFFRAVKEGPYAWAFLKKDAEKVQVLTRNYPSFDPAKHVPVSVSGLKSAKFANPWALNEWLGDRLKALDPDGDERDVVLGGVKFSKMLRVASLVWTFDREEIPAVAMLAEAQIGTKVEVWMEELQLADVVALLGSDPLRLAQYLHIYHPELSPGRVDQITITSLRGLRAEWAQEVEELHQSYAEDLAPPTMGEYPLSTRWHSIVLNGRVAPGVPQIQVVGAYTRQILVRQDGTFSATLPLPRVGEVNEFQVYALDPSKRTKSPPVTLQVRQQGKREDIEEVFLRLLDFRKETEEEIREVAGRYLFMLRSVELALLKRFTYDEEAGLRYLKEQTEQARSPAMKAVLQEVLNKFVEIAGMKFEIKPDKNGKPQRLYFFQKYTIWEVLRILGQEGARGVIIGSQQGLGKTVTTLALVNGQKAVIIAPNAMVTTWAEQEGKFFTQPNLEVLEGSHRERDKTLAVLDRSQVVTNVEFVRGVTPQRARLLSRADGYLVVDEANYLGSSSSLQSRGTLRLTAGRKILLTAAPFKKPGQIRNLLAFLYPNNPVYQSPRAFARAYPPSDPTTAGALFLLLQRHMIRIRQQDVFERFDPKIPLEQQADRLPARVRIPTERLGQFYLTQEQCDSILELFTQYRSWCEKHKGSGEVTDEDRRYRRYREGYFSKREALCQIMNDPAYIGHPEIESPKHLLMDRMVKEELAKDSRRKVLIFVKYKAQVREYLKRYERFGARAYYGDLRANANGYRVDDKKKLLYYLVDEYENFVLDDHGRPVPSDKELGRPIRALDYERILFQNDPESRVIIATDKTGGVGVTLAADVVIRDQPGDTFQDEDQSWNRAGRIDNDRKKYTVTEYRLEALYPDRFLKKLEKDVRDLHFRNGTYDQVQIQNLEGQGKIFYRIMDGVGSKAELEALHENFMRRKMPSLFVNGEAKPTGESTGLEERTPPSDGGAFRGIGLNELPDHLKELSRLGT